MPLTDTKTTSIDKKNISKTRPVSKNILPDKNTTRLKQSKQNGLLSSLSSKSSLDEPSVKSNNSSSIKKKQAVEAKTSTTKTPVRKDKVQAQYSEKRGESTLYIPKSRLSIKAPTDKSLKSKKNSEKATTLGKISRERRKSRTLSPSEVKVLRETPIDENKKTVEVDGISDVGVEVDDVVQLEDEAGASGIAKVEEDKGMYDYEEDFEEYESDFESYSGTPIGEESDNSILSIDLEPIVLRSNEQKVNKSRFHNTEKMKIL